MSGVRCGEKGVTNCEHMRRCIQNNFDYCHAFKEEIVQTGPVPRPPEIPKTGCIECADFQESPLDCLNKKAISKRLATWPFSKMCKHGKPKGESCK